VAGWQKSLYGSVAHRYSFARRPAGYVYIGARALMEMMRDIHVVLELLQVILLLGNLFSELKQLLLLAHTDSVILICLLTFAECVSVVSLTLALIY
jgi:hypothetical protein